MTSIRWSTVLYEERCLKRRMQIGTNLGTERRASGPKSMLREASELRDQ